MIITTPAAGISSSSLVRVVEDYVERAAVVCDSRDRLRDLILGRQEQRACVEVVRPGRGRHADPRDARDDALCGLEDAPQQKDDHGQEHDEEHDVADPPEDHPGLRSATIAALRAMPGRAPRMTSNWALIAVTAPSSGRRCSDSTVSSAPASVARPIEMLVSRPQTTISATASTATTTTASSTLRRTRRCVPLTRRF